MHDSSIHWEADLTSGKVALARLFKTSPSRRYAPYLTAFMCCTINWFTATPSGTARLTARDRGRRDDGRLMSLVIAIMMERPAQNYGDVLYPVVSWANSVVASLRPGNLFKFAGMSPRLRRPGYTCVQRRCRAMNRLYTKI